MSNHKHKRRRSGEHPAELNDQTVEVSNETQDPEDDERVRDAKLERDRDLWDAFREEYYEVIEQLPLTLHRQFTLMRELDQQVHDYNGMLLPALHRYVALRKTLSQGHCPPPSAEANAPHPATPPDISRAPSVPAPSARATSVISNEATALAVQQALLPTFPTPLTVQTPAASISTPRTSTPAVSIPPERPEQVKTTREMLSQMAWLSEEILRASEEKVNLAQVAYDSVDRHIRLIDQAIKEQTMAISIGHRVGTHPAPLLLPDLTVPRWSRQNRPPHSPVVDKTIDVLALAQDDEGGPTLGIVTQNAGDIQPKRRKVKQGRSKGGKKKESEPDLGLIKIPPDTDSRVRRSSRPKLTNASAVGPLPGNADEPRYCYCNQVSFGLMVACDRKGCKREWFHLACAGLNEPPREKRKWYCRDCQPRK